MLGVVARAIRARRAEMAPIDRISTRLKSDGSLERRVLPVASRNWRRNQEKACTSRFASVPGSLDGAVVNGRWEEKV